MIQRLRRSLVCVLLLTVAARQCVSHGRLRQTDDGQAKRRLDLTPLDFDGWGLNRGVDDALAGVAGELVKHPADSNENEASESDLASQLRDQIGHAQDQIDQIDQLGQIVGGGGKEAPPNDMEQGGGDGKNEAPQGTAGVGGKQTPTNDIGQLGGENQAPQGTADHGSKEQGHSGQEKPTNTSEEGGNQAPRPVNGSEGGGQQKPNTDSTVNGTIQDGLREILNGGGAATGKKNWDFCVANNECANGCCSKEYSDDNKLKCTPGGCGGGGQTSGSSVGLAHSLTNKGEWEFCSSNSECKNNCCSTKYSKDGKLKCTPDGC